MADLVFEPDSHKYLLDGIELPSVTTVIGAVLSRPWPPSASAERARMLGTSVHLMCEYDDRGILDESDLGDELSGYLRSYRKFKAEHKVEWQTVEARRYHPNLMYAGTVDRVGSVDDVPVTLDLKTGSAYATYPIQLAAYVAMVDGPKARAGLFLAGNGDYRITFYPETAWHNDFAVFCAALTVYNWRRLHG